MDRSFDDVVADLSKRRQRATETRSRGDSWSACQGIDDLADPDSFLEWGRRINHRKPDVSTLAGDPAIGADGNRRPPMIGSNGRVPALMPSMPASALEATSF